jgi:hypothetical protein
MRSRSRSFPITGSRTNERPSPLCIQSVAFTVLDTLALATQFVTCSIAFAVVKLVKYVFSAGTTYGKNEDRRAGRHHDRARLELVSGGGRMSRRSTQQCRGMPVMAYPCVYRMPHGFPSRFTCFLIPMVFMAVPGIHRGSVPGCPSSDSSFLRVVLGSGLDWPQSTVGDRPYRA